MCQMHISIFEYFDRHPYTCIHVQCTTTREYRILLRFYSTDSRTQIYGLFTWLTIKKQHTHVQHKLHVVVFGCGWRFAYVYYIYTHTHTYGRTRAPIVHKNKKKKKKKNGTRKYQLLYFCGFILSSVKSIICNLEVGTCDSPFSTSFSILYSNLPFKKKSKIILYFFFLLHLSTLFLFIESYIFFLSNFFRKIKRNKENQQQEHTTINGSVFFFLFFFFTKEINKRNSFYFLNEKTFRYLHWVSKIC